MDSPKSVVYPSNSKSSSTFAEPEKVNTGLSVMNPGCLSKKIEVQSKEAAVFNLDSFLGVLEIYIHQARDIHNICIYQKQDVYAKLYLTSDPETTVSTKIINGGGKNPVFNENLRLNVRTIDSSLKCEVWMLSRVKNYLEDQLLGFALVPLSEIVVKNGKLENEFCLSSNDLFHSPAGFVELSISYNGALPELIAIPPPPPPPVSVVSDVAVSDFENMEFPDPKIVNENDMMVSEYFSIDSQRSESLVSLDTENHPSSEVQKSEYFSIDSVEQQNHDSPSSSVSTNVSPSVSLPASSQSSQIAGASKTADVGDGERDASVGIPPGDRFTKKPVVTVNIPEQKLVQQDIVDLYMKSMQQSLANMKMEIESGPTSSGNSPSDQKSQASKNTGSRVFYGSRAFF